jgi:hypothetical protein
LLHPTLLLPLLLAAPGSDLQQFPPMARYYEGVYTTSYELITDTCKPDNRGTCTKDVTLSTGTAYFTAERSVQGQNNVTYVGRARYSGATSVNATRYDRPRGCSYGVTAQVNYAEEGEMPIYFDDFTGVLPGMEKVYWVTPPGEEIAGMSSPLESFNSCPYAVPQFPAQLPAFFLAGVASNEQPYVKFEPGPDGALVHSEVFEKTEGNTKVKRTISWSLVPIDVPRPELEVTVIGYNDARPTAGDNETEPNAFLRFEAKLKNRDGSQPPSGAKSFTFELIEVSHQPGIAMNFPGIKARGTGPDLKWDAMDGAKLENEGGKLTLPASGDGLTASAAMSSFDWGGFGVVRVTADFGGKIPVVGYLKGDRRKTRILVPKRADGSRIAEVWSRSHPGGGDWDDKEGLPAGDSHSGDGLTRYEEYRGFIESGKHTEGHAGFKDLFAGMVLTSAEAGVDLLGKLTELKVHKLRRSEFVDAYGQEHDRSINFNHDAQTPHLPGDQLAARIASGPSNRPHGVDVPGDLEFNLRNCRQVQISPEDDGDVVGETAEQREKRLKAAKLDLDQVIAHELGHCIGLVHHGDHDPGWVQWTVEDKDGERIWMENGRTRIFPLKENGDAALPSDFVFRNKIASRHVGILGGQHSGNPRCLMAYRGADTFAPTGAQSTKRFIFPGPHVPVTTMCTTDVGEAHNYSGKWFGNATAGRRSCVYSYCVNFRAGAHK